MELTQFKRILTFFAHPDDETLAAGATISKLTRLGIDVHIAIPATGIHSRRNIQTQNFRKSALKQLRANCQTAMEVLGILPEQIYLGNFPDNEMDKHSRLELIHWLEEIIKQVEPDLLLTHHRFCTNIDHQYCHEAVIVATRPGINKHISVLSGEVPSSTGYLRPVQWEPNFYVEITEKDIENKIKAINTYTEEVRASPHPRSKEVLEALAKVRGSESGFLFAEAFMIQKIFA
jgi:LmbE family N-acetylglucosaminyl deacetylase